MTITWRSILLLLAIVSAVIATLMGFDWIDSENYGGFLALAIALGLASRWP